MNVFLKTSECSHRKATVRFLLPFMAGRKTEAVGRVVLRIVQNFATVVTRVTTVAKSKKMVQLTKDLEEKIV